MQSRFVALRLVCLTTLFAVAGGCVSTRVDRLARHELSPAASGATTTSVVREAGLYTVKWVKAKDEAGAVAGTQRILAAGDRIGFSTTDDGALLAIAGDETFAITSPLPPGTRRVIWYARSETPSGLGRVAEGAANVAGAALVVTAVGVGYVALESLAHHNDRDDEERRRAERREWEEERRRSYRVAPFEPERRFAPLPDFP